MRLAAPLVLALALLGASLPAMAQTDTLNAILNPSAASEVPGDPSREAFPVTDEPISAIRIITGRPLPGDSCREALFEARPLLRTRWEADAGGSLTLPLSDLCLIEFRNDASDRAIEVRIGEDLAALAISADQRLFRGLVLVPNQTTAIPIRPLAVGELKVSVDVLWASPGAPGGVQNFVLTLAGS
ncbi:hypothetical protein [Acuticoccus mangrovi]|uniref:Uncharacterized protein n=1 Tax=Acuticoccus mangrovi TaxID=2796142 RepID=A0A934MGM4_9HYPH|nr:hypothetical protein [Acuticoccus mangrovi]MBJ3776065.1 hypothetical protein [Acuticoccus mangrovi]